MKIKTDGNRTKIEGDGTDSRDSTTKKVVPQNWKQNIAKLIARNNQAI
jgi:hypothetical protein